MTPEPTPIVELGVAEAYSILVDRFGLADLPPLDAIENEDWGRDYLLSRFLDLPADQLLEAGIRVDRLDPSSLAQGTASMRTNPPGIA